MTFLRLYILRWWRQTWDTVVNQSEARVSTEHGIKKYIRILSMKTHMFAHTHVYTRPYIYIYIHIYVNIYSVIGHRIGLRKWTIKYNYWFRGWHSIHPSISIYIPPDGIDNTRICLIPALHASLRCGTMPESPHLMTSFFTPLDHVSLGLHYLSVLGIAKSVIDLIQDVARCICPYQVSGLVNSTVFLHGLWCYISNASWSGHCGKCAGQRHSVPKFHYHGAELRGHRRCTPCCTHLVRGAR